jgi:hypothetical protein
MFKTFMIFFAGLSVGVLSTAIIMDFTSRSKHEIVYEVKKEVAIDGVVLSKGTLLSERKRMPEGFNVLQLEVRIPRGLVEDYFEVRKKDKDDRIKYWINQ